MRILGLVLTRTEQENVDKAKLLVRRLFPTAKLVERLAAFGAVDLAAPKYTYFAARLPSALRVELWFKIPRPKSDGGDVYVSVWFFALQRGEWTVTEYSMHFGPTPRDQDPPAGPNFYFRVCDNPTQKHHFHHHLHPDDFDGGHIPPSAAKPPLPATADPAWFLNVFETFLKTKKVPIEVIL